MGPTYPHIGIGSYSIIRKAIVDKNARIGKNVQVDICSLHMVFRSSICSLHIGYLLWVCVGKNVQVRVLSVARWPSGASSDCFVSVFVTCCCHLGRVPCLGLCQGPACPEWLLSPVSFCVLCRLTVLLFATALLYRSCSTRRACMSPWTGWPRWAFDLFYISADRFGCRLDGRNPSLAECIPRACTSCQAHDVELHLQSASCLRKDRLQHAAVGWQARGWLVGSNHITPQPHQTLPNPSDRGVTQSPCHLPPQPCKDHKLITGES